MKRGEVWWATLPEPWGRRPVLLLARDEAYEILTWLIVAPLTTTIRTISTAVLLEPSRDHVPARSVVALDNVQSVRSAWVQSRITELSSERMSEVDRAVHLAMGLRHETR